MNEALEHEYIRRIDRAFESLAQDLDQLANAYEVKSDAFMSLTNKYGDFITYYAEWIREGWDWANSEVVER